MNQPEKQHSASESTAVYESRAQGAFAEFLSLITATKRRAYQAATPRMRQVETHRDDEKVSPLVRQLLWSYHRAILTQNKLTEERDFAIHSAI